MAYHHRQGTAHTEGRRQACHAIIAFGQHRRSDDVGRGMPSPPFDSTLGRMTLGVACHPRPRTAHMVGLRRAWHDITTFGQHTRSNDVGGGMISPPLDRTQGRMTSGVTCHHHILTTHTVGLRRAWNDITSLLQLTRWNNVGRGMTSPPLNCTHGRTTSGVA